MKKYFSFVIFFLPFLIFYSCDAPILRPKGLSTTLISVADIVHVTGQSVTLIYTPSTQSNGFPLIFSNTGSVTCNDILITAVAPYGLISNAESFAPQSDENPMAQYTCAQNGPTIALSAAAPLNEDNFHPWLDHFNIHVGQKIFSVNVNTTFAPTQTLSRGSQMQMNLSSAFEGCGKIGTVLQRVYDCSKKITNYGVTVTTTNSISNSTASGYYTSFVNGVNADPYWFVVSCPAGLGGMVPQQNCTWLTPVFLADNPAFDTTGAGNASTFTFSFLTGYQKRLLLSGKMTNDTLGYSFGQANGFAYSTTFEVYTQGTQMLSHPNPGTIPNAAHPAISPASVCTAESGGALNGGLFPSSDANIRDIVSAMTGATISWQMPSYAMLVALSGGTPTETGLPSACPVNTTGIFSRPVCNIPLNASAPPYNVGFSAINVPGFAMSNTDVLTELLWTSSSTGNNPTALNFAPVNPGNGGGSMTSASNFLLLGSRCVSLTWY